MQKKEKPFKIMVWVYLYHFIIDFPFLLIKSYNPFWQKKQFFLTTTASFFTSLLVESICKREPVFNEIEIQPMNKYDFITLKLFVAISDTGKLSAAAEREHLALAAVSKRISDLESMVGSKLFYRQSRGVELTPAGEAFLYHARRILDDR